MDIEEINLNDLSLELDSLGSRYFNDIIMSKFSEIEIYEEILKDFVKHYCVSNKVPAFKISHDHRKHIMESAEFPTYESVEIYLNGVLNNE